MCCVKCCLMAMLPTCNCFMAMLLTCNPLNAMLWQCGLHLQLRQAVVSLVLALR